MEGTEKQIVSYTRETSDLESFLLEFILKWKLAYATPFDYIQVFILHMMKNTKSNAVMDKAVQISELFIFCIFQL